MYCKSVLKNISYFYMLIACYITGLVPLKRTPWITRFFHLLWLAWLIYAGNKTISWFMNATIGDIVGTALYQSNLVTLIITIFEVIAKGQQYRKINRLTQDVDTFIEKKLHLKVCRSVVWLRLAGPVITLWICDGLHIFINFNHYKMPVFWDFFVMLQFLRIRFLQCTLMTMEVNQRLLPIKAALSRMVSYNKSQLESGSGIWLPYEEWEYEQLTYIRLAYGRLHEVSSNVSDFFGWSMLGAFITGSFLYVCNIFWCIEMLYAKIVFQQFLYNATTLLSLGILMGLVCWYGDATEQNGRQIGCAIFELAKPLGNKDYNDLVTNFSLQNLHQQFCISAKGFFNLNLAALGAMVATIATYLVILMQFMFTEKYS